MRLLKLTANDLGNLLARTVVVQHDNREKLTGDDMLNIVRGTILCPLEQRDICQAFDKGPTQLT